MKVRITATGTRPLFMHNVRLASHFDPFSKRLKAMNGKRVKTDEDRVEIARVEWEGGMYFDPEIGPYLPCGNIFKSLVVAGRLSKAGKKVERGVVVADLMHPLIYDGPRDLESMWGDGSSRFVDLRPVKVQQATIDRCRPIFRDWAVETVLLVDPKVLDFEELSTLATTAGEMVGIGDYRMAYGRFTVKVEQL